MYLKSIEVHGFKSFANKIVFKFHDGITAIVGPNGSGKSNVADAVRWVLGEQSAKQLRGSKMEDVIFSGTQLRKPMGYAYVAITLDNSDHQLPIVYEEVTIARRVYRSGESEYLINGNVCRLREVQELFLDTGIGKEGYSIIGQGQIDKVLSGKPEDRRELFDEAAGIVKYKKRKAAAEKELAEEKQNLSRITDILYEIEKQIGPLAKQSEVAKEYLRLRDVLKNLEVNLFLSDYERSEKNKAEIAAKVKLIHDELEDSTRAYDNTKSDYERLEAKLEQYAADMDAKKEQKIRLLVQIQEKEGEIRLMQEKISSMIFSDSHYKQRQEALSADSEERKKDLSRYDKELQSVSSSLERLKEQQNDSAEELKEIRNRLTDSAKIIEHCNRQILDCTNHNAEIKAQLQHHITLEEQNSLKRSELTRQLLFHKSEEAACVKEVDQCKKIHSEITEQISLICNHVEELEQTGADWKQRALDILVAVEQTERNRIQESSKLESLRNLTERYEGYGNAIKKVMERKQDASGVIGVVADIIKVDSRYETALEIALGGNVQNIVTTNEAVAKKMVTYLKEHKFGRATFLPLTSITSKVFGHSQDTVLKEQGVIGYAHTLVKTEKEYEELIKYLVGRILVVDTMDHALTLAKKYNYTLRMVTLEGEQLNPGGSISGGAYRNNSNLLGRRREMEELEKNIKDCKKKVAELTKERDTVRIEREKIADELAAEKERLQALYLEQNTATINLSMAEEQLTKLKENYKQLEQEVNHLETRNRDTVSDAQKLRDQIRTNETAIEDAKKKAEVYNLSTERNRVIEEKLSKENAALALECAGLEKNLQFVNENRARVLAELERLAREQKILKEENSTTKERIAEQEQGIETAKRIIAEWSGELDNLEKNLAELEEKKEKLSKANKNFFSKREELSKQISELDKEAFRLNAQAEKLQETINNQANYMWEEYEITVESAKKFRDDSLPVYSSLRKEIGEVRSAIRALGDVNVNAIEDYKNYSERYELYTTQRNDLIEAEAALIKIIEQLDDEMRKQFKEKFASISKQFNVVFRELFGGGQGTLELMEDADVLTAGIRIIAQPPGKKLQNMLQLSGGEKALTAIALLFAIQNLKPSPFALLDEIEAALDDSNVGRFAGYLHKLTKNTQFIVITHRRGTMAAADVLYGITMQEKGVSTLVSVNMIEHELEK